MRSNGSPRIKPCRVIYVPQRGSPTVHYKLNLLPRSVAGQESFSSFHLRLWIHI
jgi:hypothetical protein